MASDLGRNFMDHVFPLNGGRPALWAFACRHLRFLLEGEAAWAELNLVSDIYDPVTFEIVPNVVAGVARCPNFLDFF